MKKNVLKSTVYSVLLMAFLTSCGAKNKMGNTVKEGGKPSNMSTVKEDDKSNYTMLTGTFVGKNNTIIVPKISGTVTEMSLKVGDVVNQGDILAVLDQNNIKDRINQTKAAMDTWIVAIEQAKIGFKQSQDAQKAAKASYNLTKANYYVGYDRYQNAKKNLPKTEDLYNKGIISLKEYQESKLVASDNTLKNLKKNLTEAENAVKQSEVSVEKAKAAIKISEDSYNQSKKVYEEVQKSIEDTIIKAPVRGVVVNLDIKKGEVASSSRPIMTIVNVDKICAKMEITEGLINKLKVGDKVEAYIVPLSNKKVEASISSINSKEDPKTKLHTMEVEVDNKEGKIKPGMLVNVKVFNKNLSKNSI